VNHLYTSPSDADDGRRFYWGPESEHMEIVRCDISPSAITERLQTLEHLYITPVFTLDHMDGTNIDRLRYYMSLCRHVSSD